MINFPVVCYLNGKVQVHDNESFGMMGARFLDEQTFVTKEHRSRKPIDGWILDSQGSFTELKYDGCLREWARPFSFVWNATRTRYRAKQMSVVKIGRVLDSVNSISNSSLGKLGRDFKSFLSKYEPDHDITSDVLKEWPL